MKFIEFETLNLPIFLICCRISMSACTMCRIFLFFYYLFFNEGKRTAIGARHHGPAPLDLCLVILFLLN